MNIRWLAVAGFVMALPVQAQDGRLIYESNCAVCHEAGLDRAPDRATLALMAPDRILYALERGVMVSMAVTLSTDQRRDISEFLSGESLATFTRTPPASAMCRDEPGYRAGQPDWQGWGGTGLGNHRYQPGDRAGITPANVGQLEVKWAFGFPGDIRAYSPPTIANGRLFLGSLGGGVYSLDAETGCVHWFLDVGASVRSPMTIATIDAGGREREAIFFGDGTANAYAVDAATGEILWRTEVDDFPVAHVSGSTVYYDGKVFAAVGSGEEGAAASPDYQCC
jgi:polyvinyl alcohol dehydrogenase (cytochrome)